MLRYMGLIESFVGSRVAVLRQIVIPEWRRGCTSLRLRGAGRMSSRNVLPGGRITLNIRVIAQFPSDWTFCRKVFLEGTLEDIL